MSRRRLPARPAVTRVATVDELLVRAWQAFDAAGSTTARELADVAGITRGGALAFLSDWSKSGHAARSAVAGRVAPYDVRFERRQTGSERVA